MIACKFHHHHFQITLFLKLLITLCWLVAGSLAQTTFYLDGTPSSYLQFPAWQYFFAKPQRPQTSTTTDEAASLSFDFKFTPPPSSPSSAASQAPIGGLLLYADDQNSGVFLEVKLLSESTLRLRLTDRQGAVHTRNIIELQRQEINFTDGQWHRFELIRHLAATPVSLLPSEAAATEGTPSSTSEDLFLESITLKVDSEVIHKKVELSAPPAALATSEPSNHHHNHHPHHQWVYIGGLPAEYRYSHHHHLVLSTAAYELHFRGAIRNVLYAAMSNTEAEVSGSADLRMQQPIAKHGLLAEEEAYRAVSFQQCTKSTSSFTSSPRCEHGGQCYPTTAGGVYCDCSATEHEGPYCQQKRHMVEATFGGGGSTSGGVSYLGASHRHSLSSWSFVSTAESFELSFRTKLPNGLLLYSGDDDDGDEQQDNGGDPNGPDFLQLAIVDAGLTLRLKLGGVGGSVQEVRVAPSKVRFDDHQWHTVSVVRTIREISPSTYFCHFSLTVDGIYTQHGSVAGSIPYFLSKVFYVGGGIGSTASSQFVGCLRKIIYTADTVRLDLLDLLVGNGQSTSLAHHGHSANHSSNNNNNLIRFYGDDLHSLHAHSTCQDSDASDPITFTTADSYLKLTEGWNTPKEGTLSLKIRTNEPNGLLLYSGGSDKNISSSSSGNLHDFFALELLDGQLYLVQHLGSSPVKVKASERRIDDGQWHSITVKRSGRSGQVVVDDSVVSDYISPGSSNHLDLAGGTGLYLGGYPRLSDSDTRTPSLATAFLKGSEASGVLPPQLWSTATFGGLGYIGCLRELVINDHPVDVAALAKRQDSGSVVPSCHSSPAQCSTTMTTAAKGSNGPCQNGGICREGWNRFECQCAHTAFTGSVCAKNAATLSFNGDQYLTITVPEALHHTQAESLYLRFRTKKPSGLLLTTSHYLPSQYLTLALEGGNLRLELNYGEGEKKTIIDGDGRSKLNDDKWHTVHLERRGQHLEVEVIDAEDQQKMGKQHTRKAVVELTGQQYTLKVGAIHLGALIKSSHKTVSHAKHHPGFEGYMQNFVFNGVWYFERTRDGQLSGGGSSGGGGPSGTSVRMTAKLGKKERALVHPVTFKSKYTYVGLPQLKAYSSLDLHFQFKTREANGLLFFNGGGGDKDGKPGHHHQDFIAVELVNGHLHYIFDLGDGPRRLQSASRAGSLADNRWHSVTLGRPSLHRHTMLIDDQLASTTTSSTSSNSESSTDRNQHLDLNGLLYFGGVRESMWSTLPKAVKARHGFEGCIASLDYNGATFNLVGENIGNGNGGGSGGGGGSSSEVPLIPSTLVEAGCSAPVTRCSSTACANRGICVQLWNSYQCDCDLTSYQGPTCADGMLNSYESTAYQFGPSPGLISFTFDEANRPDTRNDLLALGFLTSAKNGALVRVDSGTTADYLQLELLDGHVLAVYNLGTEDIDIGELGISVNDGKYHIVRLTRSGQNSTLQIDNHNVLTRSPGQNGAGGQRQMNIFNAHARVEIGGHKNVLRGSIEKPFVGIIAGLVFNGHRLLDMAAEDDPRVKVEGDVDLMMNIGRQEVAGSAGGGSGGGNSVLTTPAIDRLGNQMLSEPKSPSYGNSDDLIYSGQGSGCLDVNDDEECAHVAAKEGSGDDSIITPVYVAVNRLRPTTSPSVNRNRNRGDNNNWRKQCANDDDDECVEGSGAYEPPETPPISSSTNNSQSPYDNYNSYYSTPRSTWTTWMPPTVAPMNRPPTYGSGVQPPYSYNTAVPPYYYGGGNHYDQYGNPVIGQDGQMYHPLRPKTTAPSWTKPVYSVSGPTRPLGSGGGTGTQQTDLSGANSGPPEILDVPLNIPALANDSSILLGGGGASGGTFGLLPNIAGGYPASLPPLEVARSSTNDRTVMIISMIAICLIVVVIIAPIVLYFKVRLQASDAAYKVETFGGGGLGPKYAASMGHMAGLGGGGYHQQGGGGLYAPFAPVVRATSVSGIPGHPGFGGAGNGQMIGPNAATLGRSVAGTRPGTPTEMLKKKDPHEWYV